MNINHSFFNNFDKHSNYVLNNDYLLKNNKKIMKLLNIPKKDCNVSFQQIKTNSIFNSKIILHFNNFTKIFNKELVRKYLYKANETKINFKHINILKNIQKQLNNVTYTDNRYIYKNDKMISIETLEESNYSLLKTSFKFILISGSISINFKKLFSFLQNNCVLVNTKIKNLALKHFENVYTNEIANLKKFDNIILIDYFLPINIPENIKNVVVFHPGILTENVIKKYQELIIPNMGKTNNLKNQLFLVPQKRNRFDKLVLFKFDTFEKKIFSKLSTRKKKTYYSNFTDSIFADFKPIKDDNYCSICLNTIENKNNAVTKCKHSFCKQCILNSLHYSTSCPICREVISIEDVYVKSKKLQYLIKHSDKKSLIICNNPKSLKILKKKITQSKIEFDKFIYEYNSFENLSKIFILGMNDYLKHYLLGFASHCKIYTLVNKE